MLYLKIAEDDNIWKSFTFTLSIITAAAEPGDGKEEAFMKLECQNIG